MNTTVKFLIKYYRLSLEDKSEGESGSIRNQRSIIETYIRNTQELADKKSREFIDDGYTGTNFRRPGIQQVFELIGKNQVACIIVKDFSRFTRDYIELGNYLEQIFPRMEIRFISVNDRYDSALASSGDRLEVSFKGLLNNLYSHDISAKVKAAKRQLIKQGRPCSGSYPFGYRKNCGETPCYTIDEPAADIVCLIFRLALQGKKNIEIARFLNEQKLPTPSMYKRQNGGAAHGLGEGQVSIWDSTKVLHILRDERYMGTLIIGRYQSAGVGSGKVIKTPEHMWFCKKGAMPAIVSEEDFLEVQSLRPYRKRNGYKKGRHKLYRKVRCGCCGRYLYFKPSNSGASYNSFFCKQSHLDPESSCFTGYIKEQVIMDGLRILLQKQAEVYGYEEMLVRKREDAKSQEQRLSLLEQKLGILKSGRLREYQNYREQKMTKAGFLEKKELMQKESSCIEAEIIRLKDELENENVGEEAAEVLYKPDIMIQLVDTIWVYDVDRVKVSF